MDFTFSAEQDQLRAATRAFLETRAPSAYVREMVEDDRGFTDDFWSAVVDMGWTELPTLLDMTVVLEETGRLPLPGPFFSAGVLAPLAARGLGLTAPDGRGTVALEELGHGDPIDRVRTRARRKGGAWLLNGEKPLVLDGHSADWVIVVARTDAGLQSFLVERPDAQSVPTLDPTRKAARMHFDDTPSELVGPIGDHTAIWRRVADDAAVALCAELVGSSERALFLASEYAKVRVQFDRPIATFQAIKHKAAEMLHQLELLRVGTHYAAWTSDVDDPDRERAAAMAKGYAGEAAVNITGESIQIHGGVGFTWDCDAHFHYRRAKAVDLMLGYQGWQRQRVADLVLNR
ncbi:MAG TPA: acyl-CoA dehydrogenase [Acidimicrobiales bacterium]|nr:acyl-CoA dehydrogenase [Acidimicrobiales bacterium]